jgi:predicted ATP-grasp superfamily ATP-dependent carboligase
MAEETEKANITERYRRGDPRAIVLGLEHPRSVAAVHSLARAGIPVVGVDHESDAVGFASRRLTSKFLISDESEKALAFLESLGRDGGGVLIPTNDRYIIMVAKNIGRLSRYFSLTTPPWETLLSLMDISRCYPMAREVGIRTPAVFKPESEQDLARILSSLDLERHEFLLKTMPGSVPAHLAKGRNTRVAGMDRATIERECLEIFSRAGEFPAIAEVLGGTADRCIGVCMMVDRNHEAVLSYSIRRLKLHTYSKGGRFVHPYEMGANVYCQSTHDEEAEEAAKRLVRRARYYGPIAIEFRRDPADESLVLIKADPRFVRATRLSAAIGLDLPLAVYNVSAARPLAAARSYPDGVGWIWLTAYLTTLWENRADRSLRHELFSLLRNLSKVRAVAYLDLRDPWPFLVSLRRWAWQWWTDRIQGLGRKLVNRLRPAITVPVSEKPGDTLSR